MCLFIYSSPRYLWPLWFDINTLWQAILSKDDSNNSSHSGSVLEPCPFSTKRQSKSPSLEYGWAGDWCAPKDCGSIVAECFWGFVIRGEAALHLSSWNSHLCSLHLPGKQSFCPEYGLLWGNVHTLGPCGDSLRTGEEPGCLASLQRPLLHSLCLHAVWLCLCIRPKARTTQSSHPQVLHL